MLGERIRHARLANNISQKELAGRMGVAQTTVSQWENDSREPDLKTLRRLADVTGVNLAFLVEADADAGAKDRSRIYGEYGIDPKHDGVFLSMLSDAKRQNVSENDLRLALDFIRMARTREEDARRDGR